MRTPFFGYLSAFWCRIDRKTASLMVALCTLILFGDALLPLLGHVLHVLIEVVESALEHFLESVFGVSPRQAEIIVFYSGLPLVIYLAWHLSRKAYLATLCVYATAQENWCAKTNLAKAAAWLRTMIMVGVLGATLFLFT